MLSVVNCSSWTSGLARGRFRSYGWLELWGWMWCWSLVGNSENVTTLNSWIKEKQGELAEVVKSVKDEVKIEAKVSH